MKKSAVIVLAMALSLVIGLSSCNSNKHTQSAETDADTLDMKSVALDSTRLYIDEAKVDTMKIIPVSEPAGNLLIKESDYSKLASSLLTARYDTAWNNSGIMVKMVAPDFTVVIDYKDKDADNSDWLMIWKENGRTKFKDKWFFLEDEARDEVISILNSYTNKP